MNEEQGVNTEVSPASEQDALAESSTATAEPSILSVIESSIGTEESPASEATSSDDESSGSEATEETPAASDDAETPEETLPEDPTEEELTAAAPRTRKRIETLLEARKDLTSQVDSLRPRAEQWDQVERFRTENNLSPQDVATAIQMAAVINSDPARARQMLEPLWASINERAGETLPDDLEQQVRMGELTRGHALRLTRAEAARQQAEQQRSMRQQAQEQASQEQEIHRQVEMLSAASTSWEKTRAANDPDFHMKRDLIANGVEARMRKEGAPATAEAMQGLLNEVADRVDAAVGKFRTPAKPVRRDAEGASPRSAPAKRPTDTLDAINQALGVTE